VVPSPEALLVLLAFSTPFPFSSPLEKSSVQSVCGGDKCSPCLPHETSCPFSLTHDTHSISFRADERRCSLGGETSAESEEERGLKSRKAAERSAIRRGFATGKSARLGSDSSGHVGSGHHLLILIVSWAHHILKAHVVAPGGSDFVAPSHVFSSQRTACADRCSSSCVCHPILARPASPAYAREVALPARALES
jgi:hypothetical protein